MHVSHSTGTSLHLLLTGTHDALVLEDKTNAFGTGQPFFNLKLKSFFIIIYFIYSTEDYKAEDTTANNTSMFDVYFIVPLTTFMITSTPFYSGHKVS